MACRRAVFAVLCLMASPARATASQPEETGTRLSLVEMERALEAEARFVRAVEADPQLEDAEKQRLANETAREYEAVLTTNPDWTEVFILYGKFLRRIGEYDRANLAFLKANALNPNLAVVKQQIGNYLAETGEPALALAYFDAAVQLEPDVAVYHYSVGELLYQYRDTFVREAGMDPTTVDRALSQALSRVMQAEVAAPVPTPVASLARRAAELQFAIVQPDWPLALKMWAFFEAHAESAEAAAYFQLQQVRVKVALGQKAEARFLAESITLPAIRDSALEATR